MKRILVWTAIIAVVTAVTGTAIAITNLGSKITGSNWRRWKMIRDKKRISIMLISAAMLIIALLGTVTAQQHEGLGINNEQIQLYYVDEAVSVANYTDDTQEPEGWQLSPSIYWDSNGNGIFEDNESIGYALSPSVHFDAGTETHHFWPLHQSIMQEPEDATVISSGWISQPNIYASKVEDANQLVTLESTLSVLDGNNYFTQEITVTSTAATTLTNVHLILYLGIDINGFFNDYAFIDPNKNNAFKAQDVETGVWFEAHPTIAADNFEVSEWNDGPYAGDDLWQHTLNDNLDGSTSASGDVEGAFEFYLRNLDPGESESLTIYCSFAVPAYKVYLPIVTKNYTP